MINIQQMLEALNETIYMTLVSLLFAAIFGLLLGILLYCTSNEGLFPNRIINKISDFIINVLRAIPFIILLILVKPLAKLIAGTILGATAALPSLTIAAIPFFARLCVIAFIEVDKGTIEASKAMGASNWQIITKVLLKEAKPALISGISITGITLVSYTAMAGAIGAGGLGNLAYMYGFVRSNYAVLYISTILIVIIVFLIQGVNDFIIRKVDKR